MIRLRPLALLVPVSAAALLLVACGQQTDDRVASAEPTSQPSSIQSEIAAATPYVTIDCVSLQAMPTDTPPQGGAAVGGVSAIMQPTGVPSITIATNEPAATELGIADIAEGSGTEVQPGMTVTANYCGVGLGTQAVFDSSWARGEPASFPLDGVIAGWQEGLLGMKVGGQRLLVIPSSLGYGDAGTPDGSIPPGETLIFVVDLVDAQ